MITEANYKIKIITNKKYEIKNTEQLIDLANLYLNEWSHRDSIIWKQLFAYFIACLVVMLLPFMTYFEIDFDNALPKWLFPMIGLVLSIVFFVVSKGYAIRLQAIGDAYQNVLDQLPRNLQRKRIKEINNNPIYSIHICGLITNVMFISLWVIGIILLHLCW